MTAVGGVEGGVNQPTESGNRVINARMTRAKHISSVNDGGDGDDDEDVADNEDTATAAAIATAGGADEVVAVAAIVEATSSPTKAFHSLCSASNLHSSDCASGPRRETTVEGF